MHVEPDRHRSTVHHGRRPPYVALPGPTPGNPRHCAGADHSQSAAGRGGRSILSKDPPASGGPSVRPGREVRGAPPPPLNRPPSVRPHSRPVKTPRRQPTRHPPLTPAAAVPDQSHPSNPCPEVEANPPGSPERGPPGNNSRHGLTTREPPTTGANAEKQRTFPEIQAVTRGPWDGQSRHGLRVLVAPPSTDPARRPPRAQQAHDQSERGRDRDPDP